MAKEGLGLEITELRLGLPGGRTSPNVSVEEKNEKKRTYSEFAEEYGESGELLSGGDRKSSRGKTDEVVVGWPPVCNYRRKNSFNNKSSKVLYVKVSMDGAPFLRKLDLATMHEGYSDLVIAFEDLFGCYGIGKALKDAESSEYVPIYEDKDGDWMLLGDVPWPMFLESCKRLRIMKRSEAGGVGIKGSFLKGAIN